MVKDLVITWLKVGYNLVKGINIGYNSLIIGLIGNETI